MSASNTTSIEIGKSDQVCLCCLLIFSHILSHSIIFIIPPSEEITCILYVQTNVSEQKKNVYKLEMFSLRPTKIFEHYNFISSVYEIFSAIMADFSTNISTAIHSCVFVICLSVYLFAIFQFALFQIS